MGPYKKSREDGCCSVNFVKYVLFIFNFVFFIAGCVVLGVGIWTVVDKFEYVGLLTSGSYEAVVYLLIIAGILTILVSIIGLVAVLKEESCSLLIYTFLLLLIFLMEAVAGIVAYVYEKQVYHDLEANLNDVFLEHYYFDFDRTAAIDKMQREYQCCGAVYYNDWQNSRWKLTIGDKNEVPESCCITEGKECAASKHPSNIYQEPCSTKFADTIRDHLIILGAVGLGICLVQIFGMIFAICWYIQLKDYEYDY